ncbi:unnamed protein product [Ambrosiozyma monospora]|uniref:Unnamed protein product n=1 Tax=Ambrosiozyma monospora TaxID=43982 RepID=A0A9W6Z430_AMBMO|nr:unnamed protein product [Ambrosiozyma monospora]
MSFLKHIRDQLVGPKDGLFHETNYRDSINAFPSRPIDLQEPCLSLKQLDELQLTTKTALSIFGILIHKPTGLLIVNCQDKSSFAIRNNKFDINDVISRSNRNDMLAELEPDKHFLVFPDDNNGTGAFLSQITDSQRALQLEESQQEDGAVPTRPFISQPTLSSQRFTDSQMGKNAPIIGYDDLAEELRNMTILIPKFTQLILMKRMP